MTAAVHVVVCMDTEGPCADPDNAELLATWDEVDAAMGKLFEPAFRSRFPDPSGGGLRFGWFFLTWTGFATNPRSRDFGYHRVRDHYLDRWGDALASFGDEQCWHYHHPAASGVGNEWGLDWSLGDEHDRILSRQVLERGWWPVCFRAGGTIMDPASSRWVDRWFPFDYSNRAPLALPGLVDWSSGVADWTLYHPDPEDFRRPGTGRRRMARCLDLVTGVHELSEDEIAGAFERAAGGEQAILACFDHDYRDIAGRLDAFREGIHAVAARFPAVPWRYAAPAEAARAALDAARPRRLELEAAVTSRGVEIWSSESIFQSLPWLAVRSGDEVVHVEDGLLRLDKTRWRWRPELEWTEVAFAASTDLGEAATVTIRPTDGPGATFLARPMEGHALHPHSIWEHSKRFTRSAIARSAGEEAELDSARQTRDLLAARVKFGETVLDVGCAGGHLWHSIRGLELHYYGIDVYRRAIEIGRATLADRGLPPSHLRTLALEDLPPDERYDNVVCLSTLLYFPDFRLPLEIMARAARRRLVIRSSFGETATVRYLADELLEPGFETMHAYFSIFARDELQSFLEREGFAVEWIADARQQSRFGGKPEVVGGIELPYEFLLAERS